MEQNDEILALPQAGNWRRFFARIFDVWWESILFGTLIGVALAVLAPSFSNLITSPEYSLLFGIGLLFIALMIDAVISAGFGNTPGKVLLGIKVTDIRGNKLELSELLQRNVGVWLSGFGLGIPLVNLFTMASQSSRLQKGKQTSYDEKNEHRVFAKKIGFLRKVGFAFLFVILLLSIGALTALDKQMQHEEYAAEAASPKTWKNPVTGISTTIDGRWSVTELSDPTQTIYQFSEGPDQAAVIFALEPTDGWPLEDYVEAWQNARPSDFQLSPSGTYFTLGYFDGWNNHAEIDTGLTKNEAHVIIVNVDGNYWRTVKIQVRPVSASNEYADRLVDALWNTVVEF